MYYLQSVSLFDSLFVQYCVTCFLSGSLLFLYFVGITESLLHYFFSDEQNDHSCNVLYILYLIEMGAAAMNI